MRAALILIAVGLAVGLCGCQTSRDGVSVNLTEALRAYRAYANKQPTREQMTRVLAQLPAEQLTDLGVMYEREHRLDDAAWAYRCAISRDIYYTRAYVNLGNVLRQQGKPEEARARYRQALVTDPQSLEAANNFADICAAEGTDLEEAIGRLEPLIGEAGGLRPYALDTLGWLYHEKGEDARARQLLSSALSEAGTSMPALRPVVHGHLAAVCKALGLSEEAAQHEAEARR